MNRATSPPFVDRGRDAGYPAPRTTPYVPDLGIRLLSWETDGDAVFGPHACGRCAYGDEAGRLRAASVSMWICRQRSTHTRVTRCGARWIAASGGRRRPRVDDRDAAILEVVDVPRRQLGSVVSCRRLRTAAYPLREQLALRANAFAEGSTPREHDVLLLIARGLDNKRIAERLGLGIQTTKNHSSAIRTKLHASSRIEAAIKARQAGLID